MPFANYICFIACHGASADHFATYAKTLIQENYSVQVYVAEKFAAPFEKQDVPIAGCFSLANLKPEEETKLAQELAKTCAAASIVLTDAGGAFDAKIHQAFLSEGIKVPHYAYYDNPEPFVPGGYSATAAKVMRLAQGVLFANATLADATLYSDIGREVDLSDKKRFGVGYYPMVQVERIAAKREFDQAAARALFLKPDQGEKLLVYFGGNNETYFSQAFPAFLTLLRQTAEKVDLSQAVIVLQQHPAAKAENRDRVLLESWLKECEGIPGMPRVVVSDRSSEEAQIAADGAFYYQTSMAAQFILEGIPTVQIGHDVYEDCLVRNQVIPAITTSHEFTALAENLDGWIESSPDKSTVLNSLGFRDNWPELLKQALK